MARQPRTRKPKEKFSHEDPPKCWCGAFKFIYKTRTGLTWQCTENITH